MVKKLLVVFLITIPLGLIAGLVISRLQSEAPLVSPLTEVIAPLAQVFTDPTPAPKPKKIVFGFLPYWNLKYTSYLHYGLLTHLAYFGLDYQADGNILTRMDDGSLEPGWQRLQDGSIDHILQTARTSHTKNILTLRAMTQDIISSIVNSPTARKTAITQTLKYLQDHNFDGLNIDFEYAGTPDNNTRNNFSLFVKDLSTACKTLRPDCEISISVFGDSGVKYRLWDYAAIEPSIDLFIIMTYDYYRTSSSQAGPVSPLRGACTSPSQGTSNCLDSDISSHIAALTRKVPSRKLLLGVPFYGYEWQTATTDFLSNTYDQSGGIATYKRVQDLLSQSSQPQPIHLGQKVYGIQEHWSDLTLTPYIIYETKAGQIQQIHYENTRSLSLKYDFVNQNNLAGIAIWALGYEVPYSDLWLQIQGKFATK